MHHILVAKFKLAPGDASLTNWKLNWALLKKQEDGPVSAFCRGRRLSRGSQWALVSWEHNLILTLNGWSERQSYFQTVLNLEVVEPASRTEQGPAELWPTVTGSGGQVGSKPGDWDQPGILRTCSGKPFLPPVFVTAIPALMQQRGLAHSFH